jgi:hypothetical protein
MSIFQSSAQEDEEYCLPGIGGDWGIGDGAIKLIHRYDWAGHDIYHAQFEVTNDLIEWFQIVVVNSNWHKRWYSPGISNKYGFFCGMTIGAFYGLLDTNCPSYKLPIVSSCVVRVILYLFVVWLSVRAGPRQRECWPRSEFFLCGKKRQ